MSSPRKNSFVNDILLDIPSEYVDNGKTLSIESYSEIVLDGYHLSKPSQFIKHVHNLCLTDTQRQQRSQSITAYHQLVSDIDPTQLIQIVFILSPQILNQGKTIRVAKGNRLNNEQIRNVFNENKQIRIEIGNEDLQRGKIIVIENNQIEFFDCEQYEKQQKHNLTDNPFFKRDFLQSKGQMEISIRISPDFFLQGQTVSFAKEDPQMIAANFPYRRQSRPSLPINNDLNSLN